MPNIYCLQNNLIEEVLIREKVITSKDKIIKNKEKLTIRNIINQQNLTDAHTCYKLFNSKLFMNLKLSENDFAFCPEVTTKISNLNLPIYEVPISYNGRGYNEGKKIGINDAFRVFSVILKYKFLK